MRLRQPVPSVLFCALAAAVFVLAWCAIALTDHSGRVAVIWLANGLWLGAVLAVPSSAGRLLLAGMVGDLAANVVCGDRPAVAIWLCVCNCAEVGVSAWVIRGPGQVELWDQATFIRFFAVGVLGTPLISALLAACGLFVLTGAPPSENFIHWFMSDVLGMAIVVPAVLVGCHGDLCRRLSQPGRARTFWSVAALAAVAAGVFMQQRYPLLFLIPPVVAWVAVETGYAATAVSMPLLAVAAIGGTLAGHGPFTLNQKLGQEERMLLIQGFLLVMVAASAWAAFIAEDRRRAMVDLAEANERLLRLAMTDPLTGLANRRALEEALDRELRLVERGFEPLSLLAIDVDHFKLINDTLGHPAGDERLRLLGTQVRQAARRRDDVGARSGGEEFAVLLPGAGSEMARDIAETLRSAVEAMEWPGAPGQLRRMTVSIGVATATASTSATWLMAEADNRLYRAKRSGRNRVVSEAEDRMPVSLGRARMAC